MGKRYDFGGTIEEWNADGSGLLHSALPASAEGGSIIPSNDEIEDDNQAEWSAMHEFVHGPALDWLQQLVSDPNVESRLPLVARIACSCIGLRLFQARTGLDNPDEDFGSQKELYQIIVSTMAMGAAMYKAAVDGDLVFGTDGDENDTD